MTAERLSDENFSRIVRNAPLISIDLIMRDHERKILVGLRANEPARGWYFVPGGAIRKNERIESAFERIVEVETSHRARLGQAKFLGVFQHFYETNRFGDPEYGTHYVVLGYELALDHRPQISPDAQHNEFRWMDEAALIAAPDVHQYTKAYFQRPLSQAC